MWAYGFYQIHQNSLTTEHQPPTATQGPTDLPTTDSIVTFKKLVNRKIFILQNTHSAAKIISVYYLFDE